MKTPSIKALVSTFDITREQAALIKVLGEARSNRDALASLLESKCPETYAYAQSCYNDPFDSRMWRTTLVPHAIDRIVGTCGVESLGEGEWPTYAPPYEYCNAGDPYVATLIYKRATDNLYVGCWGVVAERLPSRDGY